MAILLQPQTKRQISILPKEEAKKAKFEENITPYSPPQALHYPILAFILDGLLIAVAIAVTKLWGDVFIALDNIPAPAMPIIFAGIVLIWLATFSFYRVYRIERYSQLWTELHRVFKIAILSQIIAMGLLYVVGWQLSQTMFVRHFVVSIGFLFGWRTLYHAINYISFNAGTKLHRRVLVISSSERVTSLLTMLRQAHTEYMTVVGFVADAKFENQSDYLGDLDANIATLVEKQAVDDIVMAFTYRDKAKAREFFHKVQQLPVNAYVLPDYMDIKFSGDSVKRLEDLNLVNITMPKLNKVDLFLKRAFDIVVASVALFLAAPVMAMIALLIKMESDGPILFIQERMGYGKQKFPIFKFRSMRVNADSELNSVSERDADTGRITNHKRPNDPRITRIGKFIRKTSLDELPQIFNVLRGDMSLVGPRPELLCLVDEYEPWQDQRFIVKQGITGWWQVNGRSATPCHFSTHQDVEYINQYSFLLDIQILLLTIPALLKGKGAF